MSIKISTFMMFTGEQHGKAEAAINLYTSVFENSAVQSLEKYAANDREPEGSVKLAAFTLNGVSFKAIESSMAHGFTFTPAISLFVEMDTEEKVDAAFARLSEGGKIMMPLDKYPFSKKFAWLADRFGVSWQLSLV